jgi:hypothetical protein
MRVSTCSYLPTATSLPAILSRESTACQRFDCLAHGRVVSFAHVLGYSGSVPPSHRCRTQRSWTLPGYVHYSRISHRSWSIVARIRPCLTAGACETGIAQNYQTHVTVSSNCGPSFVIEAQSSEASNPGFIPPLGTPSSNTGSRCRSDDPSLYQDLPYHFSSLRCWKRFNKSLTRKTGSPLYATHYQVDITFRQVYCQQQ